MENTTTTDTTIDPSIDVVDVAVTGSVVATALMASMDTTPRPSPR
jgi:hypothetical protein